MTEFRKVVAAVDGSDGSIRAARVAVRLARGLDAPLELLHVFPLMSKDLIGALGLSEAELSEIRDRSARETFAAVARELGETGLAVKQVARAGSVAEEILDYLGNDPGVLLVIGRRGQTAMSALLLGSVSDRVLRHTRSAVTVVG